MTGEIPKFVLSPLLQSVELPWTSGPEEYYSHLTVLPVFRSPPNSPMQSISPHSDWKDTVSDCQKLC